MCEKLLLNSGWLIALYFSQILAVLHFIVCLLFSDVLHLEMYGEIIWTQDTSNRNGGDDKMI